MTKQVDPFEAVSEKEEEHARFTAEVEFFKTAYVDAHEYGVNVSAALLKQKQEHARLVAERDRYRAIYRAAEAVVESARRLFDHDRMSLRSDSHAHALDTALAEYDSVARKDDE